MNERPMPECAFEPTLRATLVFELLSLFGRTVLRRAPPDVGTPRYLNLGAGTHRIDGWVNADFYAVQVWKLPRDYWAVDLRYPLPCRDATWDGILCEHTLEHLCPRDAHRLLREMLRTLRRGAWARISVPDLAKYVAAYRGSPPAPEFADVRGAEVIWNLTQNWGHRSVWDADALVSALQGAGFVDVREVGFGEGTDARLLQDLPARAWESLYVEARRP